MMNHHEANCKVIIAVGMLVGALALPLAKIYPGPGILGISAGVAVMAGGFWWMKRG